MVERLNVGHSSSSKAKAALSANVLLASYPLTRSKTASLTMAMTGFESFSDYAYPGL